MKRALLAALLFFFAMPSARGDGPLRSIVIFGNEKTERSTILGLIGVQSQQFVNQRLINEVDDRLVNSGLFKSVNVRKVDNRDGTSDLRVVVVEKQLWFIFPSFQAWSGRYNGGLVFGESNLFAPNTSTLMLIDGGNKLSRFFGAVDSRGLFDTNHAFRAWVLARDDDVPLFTDSVQTSEINIKDAAIAINPGYQWTNDIRTSFRFLYRRVHYGDSSVVTLGGTEGNEISVEFEFLYDSLRRREAFLSGTRFRVSYEGSYQQMGTDYPFNIQSLEWKFAQRFQKYFNYVGSVEGTIGSNLPFHRELTLGGSSLRGYDDREFRGDTELTAKQDLLFALYRHPRFSIFGTVFFDSGLLYSENVGISRDAWNNGTGGGLRVSLSDILAPVFGVDFAYGLEDAKFHIYFALGLVTF